MATAAATPEVFTRKASGLVRVMSPYSAFIYNILTMGLIFPWTYLWAPGALPGGKLVWGIILATILEIPIAFAYVWLSTALPRSGGDYVFQSRAFGGGWGFTLLMSGFVIWILQWVAMSGWLISYLGFAPLFYFDWLQSRALHGLWAVLVWTATGPLIGLCADLTYMLSMRLEERWRGVLVGAVVQAATFAFMLLGLTQLYVDPSGADSHVRLFDTHYYFTAPWMVVNGAFGGFTAWALRRGAIRIMSRPARPPAGA